MIGLGSDENNYWIPSIMIIILIINLISILSIIIAIVVITILDQFSLKGQVKDGKDRLIIIILDAIPIIITVDSEITILD